MNFPLLRKLLWKIHFMLVYSSKTLDWIVTKQETWPGECEKSAGTAKPVGILEGSVCLPPLAYLSSWTVTFSQQRGCPHCSCARWLGGGTAHASHSLTPWRARLRMVRGCGCPDLGTARERKSLKTSWQLSDLSRASSWIFFLFLGCACFITSLLLMLFFS